MLDAVLVLARSIKCRAPDRRVVEEDAKRMQRCLRAFGHLTGTSSTFPKAIMLHHYAFDVELFGDPEVRRLVRDPTVVRRTCHTCLCVVTGLFLCEPRGTT